MTLRVRWSDLDERRRVEVLRRPAGSAGPATREAVAPILEAVRARGDAALHDLTLRFDGVRLASLAVGEGEIERALAAVTPERRRALDRAVENLTRFHEAELVPDFELETQPGVRCGRITRPIAKVGLYAPGGSAPLASTVLMLGVPARLARCPTRVLCTPPRRDGSVDPHLLVAAHLTGIERVYKIGGAQAVAALAYGTESVPKADKIFGPGNSWVTLAKLMVAEDPQGAAIDMPAGPSEVLVIADAGADPVLVAADMLSQAEHGADSQAVLVAIDAAVVAEVERELARQLELLPRRDVARASLEHAVFIEVADRREALAVANRYAPEHLILQTADARGLVDEIESAGSVFVGPHSPESVGDYASGTNHVLPTYGYARVMGGLSVDAFTKKITVQELSAAGLVGIGQTVEILAELEGLDAHRRAVSLRLARLRQTGVAAAAHESPAALARAAVRGLVPYASARGSVAAAPVLLDANESPWSPLEGRPDLNRYPAPQPAELVERLAALYGVPARNLIVGRGTDDVIDWLLRAFCEARQDGVVVCPPTYGVYAVFAELQGARAREVPLGPAPRFTVDDAAVLDAWRPGDKLVFLCSPNNPTGTLVPAATVLRLCDALRGRAVVVLDEAYVEFAAVASLAVEAAVRSNLVVLRTLSKAHGLAGARCGAGIAHPAVIELLHKVRPPYPLARPATEAVLAALAGDGPARAAARVERLRAERRRLAERLRELAIVREVFASEANFVLARFADAARVVAACRAAGVVVRDRGREHGLAGCVRVTVGAREENDLLLATLSGLVE